jgi:Luciferase-like monooxygenase
MLPLGADESGGFANLRAMAIAAEDSGLDSVRGADHLMFRDGQETEGIHECWTVLSAVAAVTSRVEIGPLVLALPFRNPALTAKMAALAGYAELGISHLIVHIPRTPAAVVRLGEAAALARERLGVAAGAAGGAG